MPAIPSLNCLRGAARTEPDRVWLERKLNDLCAEFAMTILETDHLPWKPVPAEPLEKAVIASVVHCVLWPLLELDRS